MATEKATTHVHLFHFVGVLAHTRFLTLSIITVSSSFLCQIIEATQPSNSDEFRPYALRLVSISTNKIGNFSQSLYKNLNFSTSSQQPI